MQYFISLDGTLSRRGTNEHIPFNDFQPECVMIQGDLNFDRRWPIQTVTPQKMLWRKPYLGATGRPNCRFESERRVRALVYMAVEGQYLFTNSEEGSAEVDDKGNWLWPLELAPIPNRRSTNLENMWCVDVAGAISQRGIFNHLGSSSFALTVTHVFANWSVPDVSLPEHASFARLMETRTAACQNSSLGKH